MDIRWTPNPSNGATVCGPTNLRIDDCDPGRQFHSLGRGTAALGTHTEEPPNDVVPRGGDCFGSNDGVCVDLP